MGDYGALRQGLFRFLDRGRAFGNEGQLQGVPMELDALTSSPTRPWARHDAERQRRRQVRRQGDWSGGGDGEAQRDARL
eukprot:1001064-Heterocapsa_arctica.AAC.1